MKKIEKETILITSEGDSAYEIFTYNSSLKRRLAAFAEGYPELCRKMRFGTDGSETYSVNKSRVSIRLIPPYSEERRKKLSNQAKKTGLKGTYVQRQSG